MAIARSLQEEMTKSSWIRKMFEAGEALKTRGGGEIFDFSLGSPNLEPPREFQEALKDLVHNPIPGMHRYMPNAGYPSTRKAVADLVSGQEQVSLEPLDVIMTVGAAGALNVALTSILDPGDEVIILAPYFVEYMFYVRNHGGTVRVVQTTEDFDIDLEAIERATTEHTKALIINTPHNPTGRIYSQEKLDGMSQLLGRLEQRTGSPIHLLVDTPYAKITYDAKNPLLFKSHPATMIAHSHSKDLGIAGQRIGYLIINPHHPDRQSLRTACTVTNRTLGFVNAPALMQLALERSLHSSVDVSYYRENRDLLCNGLAQAGYQFVRPEGAFYVFPRTPVPDDLAFTRELLQENVLVVPGSGFGRAGHIRIAFCVARETVQRALPRFAKVIQRVKRG